jgi:hypothetical protein
MAFGGRAPETKFLSYAQLDGRQANPRRATKRELPVKSGLFGGKV